MADLSLEAWQQYTLGGVMAAVDAGADGIVFDNAISIYGRQLLEQFTARVLAEARRKNPQIIQMSNYPRALMITAEGGRRVTSELGAEPGIFDSQLPSLDQWNSPTDLLRVPAGLLELCRRFNFQYESEGTVRNRTPALSGHSPPDDSRALRRPVHLPASTDIADI